MNPRARVRLPAKQREQQILRTAIRVFARSNYRVAGIAEIAAEAGIAEPTIYKYFPSKKDLFIRILERIGERILEIWGQVASAQQGGRNALRRVGSAYLEGLRTHPDELKIQFQALAESDDPDIARQLRENHKGYVRFLAGLVAEAKKKGAVRREVDPNAAGWFLNGVGFTLTMVRLLGLDRKVDERRLENMIDGYIDWLAAPGGGGSKSAPRKKSRAAGG